MPATPCCPLCSRPAPEGAASRVAFHSYRPTEASVGTRHHLETCAGCGLVYVPVAEPGSALALYVDYEDPTYEAHFAGRVLNADLLLDQLAPFARDGAFLDVGCSTGPLLLAAERRGYSSFGIDPSRWATRLAGHRRPTVQGALPRAPFRDQSFAVAAAVDVLEHSADPLSLLTEIHRLLRPGGLLLAAVPDVSGLSARLLGRRWWGYNDHHLVYFDRATFDQALQRTGFTPRRHARQCRAANPSYLVRRGSALLGPAAGRLGAWVADRLPEAPVLSLDLKDGLLVIAERV